MLPGFPRISDHPQDWTARQRRDLKSIWDDILRVFNMIRRSTGITGAIASGTAVNHALGAVPSFVLVTAQDAGPTDIYVTARTSTTFVINYGGGGTHVFGWSAEL